jgi:hypothetical protein
MQTVAETSEHPTVFNGAPYLTEHTFQARTFKTHQQRVHIVISVSAACSKHMLLYIIML